MNKSKSEHLFYLGIGVLVVVVLAMLLGQRLTNISMGPLDVGFADSTNPTDTPAPPTEPPVDQDDPAAPTITPTPEPTLDDGRSTEPAEPTEAPPPTATVEEGIRNPSGPVPAGTPVLAGDLALHVGPGFELLQAGGSKPAVQIAIPIAVENRGIRFDLFLFARDGITLKDDLGNQYGFASGKKTEWSADQQMQIPFNQTVDFVSSLDFDPSDPTSLPAFEGPIVSGASQLILSFSDFGAFDGVEFTIDL
jgi:hypothetical protein